jgi:hypothetical protein
MTTIKMTQPMTEQQSFPPPEHADDLDEADYAMADRQRTGEDHTRSIAAQYKTWDRFEQLEFLKETTTETFQQMLLEELVASMTNDEFSAAYEYITRMNGMARDYQELDRMSQIPS